MSAMVLHLGLEKPSKNAAPKKERVLIWGGSSSIGFYAIQIASQAGYSVVTTASRDNYELVKSAGVSEVLDYCSPSIYEDLLALGPFKAIFGASESAADQVIIGQLLQAQGGGKFLTSMGVRPHVVLPEGVEGFFVQYMDDYLKPEFAEFTRWLYWEWQEEGLVNGTLKLGRVEIAGGLGMAGEALGRLERGEVKGKKLVINPHLD
jgi:NADPH-dependent curcumin reductase CurA